MEITEENEMKQFDELETLIVGRCGDKNLEQQMLALLGEIEIDYKKLQTKNEKLDEKIDALEKEVKDFVAEIEELTGENVENKDVLLKAFADHRNWDGNTFLPPEAKFAISAPDQLADRVLNGDTI